MMDATYTAEQLREWAEEDRRGGVPPLIVADLCDAHADLLDRKASIEAAQGEDVREAIAALQTLHASKKRVPAIGGQILGLEEYRIIASGNLLEWLIVGAALLESLSAKLAEREAELAALKGHAVEPRIGLNSDGSLDEVVGSPGHIEQLDSGHWFVEIGEYAIWLHAKGKIVAHYEHRAAYPKEIDA